MKELSLNVLDIAQNSISAGATLITIETVEDEEADRLSICILDNGRGMTPEQVAHVTDPFFTTRTTRKVGLGVPLFKMAAEMAGGAFSIQSEPGKGTAVRATFQLSNVDRMPLGDMEDTIFMLIHMNPQLDFVYQRGKNGRAFTLDTRQLRQILGDVPFNDPEVGAWIKGYLSEQLAALSEEQAVE